MTTRDVSSELGIPVGTLRYYRSAGTGPVSFRLAGRVRYRRSQVLAWIAEQEQATRRGGGIEIAPTDPSARNNTTVQQEITT